MSAIDEPPRLSEDPSSEPELSDFMRALRAEMPSPDVIDSLARSVEARVQGGGGGGPGRSGFRSTPWNMATIGLVVTVIGVLGLLGVVVLREEHPVDPPRRTAEATQEPLQVVVSPPAEPPSAPVLSETPREASPRRAQPRRGAREAREREVPPPETSPSPPPSEAPNEPPSAETEIALLARARHALRRDPAHTLTLTEEHRARFSDGQFIEEREVLAIDALIALSHRSRAEARAARFYERFPNSVHRRHVEEALASR